MARWLDPQPRQNYIATELTHFVGRGMPIDSQYDLLVRILRTGRLSAPPHDPRFEGNLTVNSSASLGSNEMYSPQMICFCDIPPGQLAIHCSKYSTFGLSFSKRFAADRGARPVWYLPRDGKVRSLRTPDPRHLAGLTPSEIVDAITVFENAATHFDQSARDLRSLMKESAEWRRVHGPLRFFDFDILSFIKFFDLHLEDEHPDNYYFEREWRMLHSLSFRQQDVVSAFVPANYSARMRREFPSLKVHTL
jgi:hypothetical protein